MRILMALAMLAGCDDGNGSGFQGLQPYDGLPGDGLTACPDVADFQPEDWVEPAELAEADRDGIRGCFLDQRLVVEFNNRCRDGDDVAHQPMAVILDACADQPDPSGGGFPDCWSVWAAGTCNEIADAPGCAGILPMLRDQDRLACP